MRFPSSSSLVEGDSSIMRAFGHGATPTLFSPMTSEYESKDHQSPCSEGLTIKLQMRRKSGH